MTSFIEINKKALFSNISEIKKQLPERYKFIAVVKGNAYGHGLSEIAQLISDKVDGFQVDDIDELRTLRKYTKKPIYVLGYVDRESLEEAVSLGCTLSVFSYEQLSSINIVAKNLGIRQPVHIKIDALTGRMGFFVHEISKVVETILALEDLTLTGVYSHLTGLKEHINHEHTSAQLALFIEGLNKIGTLTDIRGLDIHISSSAGAFIPEIINNNVFNMIRVGKAMYGIWPSAEIPKATELMPVLSWKSKVAQIKSFPADYPIGYHATIHTKKSINAAVVPQGYSDGYDKKMSEQGNVLIHGVKCPVLGKIAMSMFLVDVSHLKNISQEEEVVLIGAQKKEVLTLAEVGERMGATSCEILSKISPLLPRVII